MRLYSGYGWSTIAGAILFVIAVLFHPILVNPWDTEVALESIEHSRHWIWDHALFMIALSMWILGLSGVESLYKNVTISVRNAGRLLISSLAVWMVVLALEIGILPYLVSYMQVHSDIFIVAESLFTFGLLAAYLAMAFIWLAVILFSHAKIQENHTMDWSDVLWYLSGVIALLSTILLLIFPKLAFWFLAGMAPAFIWTILSGWKMIKT